MPRFTIKDGNLSAESYVKAAGEYTCPKGTTTKFVLDWPEGMTVTSTINVNNVKCGCCGETAVLPQGNYSVKDGVLVRENTASA